jgi:hypothetical protein
MSLRPPDLLGHRLHRDQLSDILQSEMLAEKAASLGHHGRLVEAALAALRSHDAGGGPPEERLGLVKEAAREVWAFFIQRELCGLRDQKDVIRLYRIPGEVLVRLGAFD